MQELRLDNTSCIRRPAHGAFLIFRREYVKIIKLALKNEFDVPKKLAGFHTSNSKAVNTPKHNEAGPNAPSSCQGGQISNKHYPVEQSQSTHATTKKDGAKQKTLEREILDITAFTGCGNHFLKKCNVIKKVALAGKWKPTRNASISSYANIAVQNCLKSINTQETTHVVVAAQRQCESVSGQIAEILNILNKVSSRFKGAHQ